MNPKHNNPTSPERTAHAPYNFVPLPEKVVPAQPNLSDQDLDLGRAMDHYHCACYPGDTKCENTAESPINERGRVYSGVIKCEIVAESPVYVRGMAETDFFAELKEKPVHEMDDKRKRQYARFYSLANNGQPAIPGSSLRGMIRSIV